MSTPPSDLALLGYQAISAYISLDPPRGQRTQFLRVLAEKTWTLPDGRTVRFAAETLRAWVRRYRRGGLAALGNAPRRRRGVHVLSGEQIERVCQLKRDVPARSMDRIIEVAEALGQVPTGLLSRSTVHRVLHAQGLSDRKAAEGSTQDLDRFEAAFPNDLWQSDMMAGPWLPDPGKQRRAWMHAFLDDHSRLLLSGRFAFKGDLPTLELVFREALRTHGVPKRVYYDNGGPYRSQHMAQATAALGSHVTLHTQPYRPEGHARSRPSIATVALRLSRKFAPHPSSPSTTSIAPSGRGWTSSTTDVCTARPARRLGTAGVQERRGYDRSANDNSRMPSCFARSGPQTRRACSVFTAPASRRAPPLHERRWKCATTPRRWTSLRSGTTTPFKNE
jgi:putative transposase